MKISTFVALFSSFIGIALGQIPSAQAEALAKTLASPLMDETLFGLPKFKKRTLPSYRMQSRLAFDFTSFVDTSLINYEICKTNYNPTQITRSGHSIKVLGAAVVYMSPGFAASIFGHMGERFIYCRDDEFFDVYFDYTSFIDDDLNDFRARYAADLGHLPNDYENGLHGKFYIKRQMNPATRWVYGFHQANYNRDIFELWLDVEEKEAYRALLSATDRYEGQAARVKQNNKLVDYKIFEQNCTHPILEDSEIMGAQYKVSGWNALPPGAIYRYLKTKEIARSIVYPSQRLFRKLRLAQSYESDAFENIAPLSKVSAGATTPGFMLYYNDAAELWKQLMLSPMSGILNLVGGVGETVWGLITIPVNLASHIPGLESIEVKSGGIVHAGVGIASIGTSVVEFFGLRSRYPSATEWNKDEISYFQGPLLNQPPLLLDFAQQAIVD